MKPNNTEQLSSGFEYESGTDQGYLGTLLTHNPRHTHGHRQDELCPSIYELRRDLSIAIGDEVERLEVALHDQIERIDGLGTAGKGNGIMLDKLRMQAEVQAEEQVRVLPEKKC